VTCSPDDPTCSYCNTIEGKVGWNGKKCKCDFVPGFSQDISVSAADFAPVCPYASDATAGWCANSCYQGQADCDARTVAEKASLPAYSYYRFDPFVCDCYLEKPETNSCPTGYKAATGETTDTPKRCLVKPHGTSLSGVSSLNSLKLASSDSSTITEFALAQDYSNSITSTLLPDRCYFQGFDEDNGDECICSKKPEDCHGATPYFDPTECACVCPIT